ncbi:hypothetical protein JQ621_23120 [Bradyrhizobium manausense]|uniref:hypothetical protein n=1 Tax=Bradyrhizobium manausense TaxID=989370 RepID=UPI001BA7179D|nr:hypothetical protein [Bradyrhizobium manausense]MBR1090367.1 hypothetical protein [Bradyrhizobium manausense]
MADDKLFGDLPEQAKPQANVVRHGAPRPREPKRDYGNYGDSALNSSAFEIAN